MPFFFLLFIHNQCILLFFLTRSMLIDIDFRRAVKSPQCWHGYLTGSCTCIFRATLHHGGLPLCPKQLFVVRQIRLILVPHSYICRYLFFVIANLGDNIKVLVGCVKLWWRAFLSLFELCLDNGNIRNSLFISLMVWLFLKCWESLSLWWFFNLANWQWVYCSYVSLWLSWTVQIWLGSPMWSLICCFW